jgi:hypothetical protein
MSAIQQDDFSDLSIHPQGISFEYMGYEDHFYSYTGPSGNNGFLVNNEKLVFDAINLVETKRTVLEVKSIKFLHVEYHADENGVFRIYVTISENHNGYGGVLVWSSNKCIIDLVKNIVDTLKRNDQQFKLQERLFYYANNNVRFDWRNYRSNSEYKKSEDFNRIKLTDFSLVNCETFEITNKEFLQSRFLT